MNSVPFIITGLHTIMFRNLFTKTIDKTLLGRWGRTDELANTIKVYWANIDHCGTCSGERPTPQVDKKKEPPSQPADTKPNSDTSLNK